MFLREEVEAWEEERLAPLAVRSRHTRGRLTAEEPCRVRTEFQRDRDRIIHSKGFRRLKHKTQVFIAPEGDHYRTRLTHTVEVAQIARTMSRALCLNEDLAEAIALGHDLGHTPFGHAGEEALDAVHPNGFRHNEQSLRVVDILEQGTGLNLTWEVRDGIENHTGLQRPVTLEGQAVRIADRVAYINHDIDDAVRSGIITSRDLPSWCLEIIGGDHRNRINAMVIDVIEHSWNKDVVSMSPWVQKATDGLRDFLFEKVYVGSLAKAEEEKAKGVVKALYEYYQKNPGEIAPQDGEEGVSQRICDYIAGMTDRYAIGVFSRLFVPVGFHDLKNK